jgi:hypothetical protein
MTLHQQKQAAPRIASIAAAESLGGSLWLKNLKVAPQPGRMLSGPETIHLSSRSSCCQHYDSAKIPGYVTG